MKFFFGRLVVISQINLVIFLLAVAVITHSSFLEHLDRDQSQNDAYCYTDKDANEHQKTKDCQGLYYKALDDPVALFTGLLVIFTGVLAVFTYLLFSVAAREGDKADEALAIARISAEASMKQADIATASGRAHVRFVKPRIQADRLFQYSDSLGKEVDWVVHAFVDITNFGNSPADIINVAGGINIGEERDFKILDVEPFTLAPNSTDEGIEIFRRVTINESVSRSLEDEEIFIYLTCRIDYVDVFGADNIEHAQWRYDRVSPLHQRRLTKVSGRRSRS